MEFDDGGANGTICNDGGDLLIYMAATGVQCYSGPLIAGTLVSDIRKIIADRDGSPGLIVKLLFEERCLGDVEDLFLLKVEDQPLVLKCVRMQEPCKGCTVVAKECIMGKYSGKQQEMVAGNQGVVESKDDSEIKVVINFDGRIVVHRPLYIPKEEWWKLSIVDAQAQIHKMSIGNMVVTSEEIEAADGQLIKPNDKGIVKCSLETGFARVVFQNAGLSDVHFDDFDKLDLIEEGWQWQRGDVVQARETIDAARLDGRRDEAVCKGSKGTVKRMEINRVYGHYVVDYEHRHGCIIDLDDFWKFDRI
eukprot:TRINITY_DN17504_c0_g1_i1.p1 TRINITY_DN17504_c0_g1~~TRINITY_DN17504_c0_g1_i1.p1  ORF type:complete len:306 (+),score=50.69 TRINITY_DN17504_c0_g1_i1:90-1007(+)